jgi:hypothetical protein
LIEDIARGGAALDLDVSDLAGASHYNRKSFHTLVSLKVELDWIWEVVPFPYYY